jgi:hypothetical protein
MRMTVIVDKDQNPVTDAGVEVGLSSIHSHLSLKTINGAGGDHPLSNYVAVGCTDGTTIYFVVDKRGPRITIRPRF